MTIQYILFGDLFRNLVRHLRRGVLRNQSTASDVVFFFSKPSNFDVYRVVNTALSLLIKVHIAISQIQFPCPPPALH